MENQHRSRVQRDGEAMPTVSVNMAYSEDGAPDPVCTTMTGHGAVCLAVNPGDDANSYKVSCGIVGAFSKATAMDTLETALESFETNFPGIADIFWGRRLMKMMERHAPELAKRLANLPPDGETADKD